MSMFQIPEGFIQAEEAMLKYFDGMEKGYTVEGQGDQLTVTDEMSEYWADVDLKKHPTGGSVPMRRFPKRE